MHQIDTDAGSKSQEKPAGMVNFVALCVFGQMVGVVSAGLFMETVFKDEAVNRSENDEQKRTRPVGQ
jgi:hypothetical protein